MRVDVTWSRVATAQFRALSHAQQQSVRNTVQAITMSPRAAHYYQTVQQTNGRTRIVWVAYGLLVRVLFTLADEGAQLVAQILDVAPPTSPASLTTRNAAS